MLLQESIIYLIVETDDRVLLRLCEFYFSNVRLNVEIDMLRVDIDISIPSNFYLVFLYKQERNKGITKILDILDLNIFGVYKLPFQGRFMLRHKISNENKILCEDKTRSIQGYTGMFSTVVVRYKQFCISFNLLDCKFECIKVISL